MKCWYRISSHTLARTLPTQGHVNLSSSIVSAFSTRYYIKLYTVDFNNHERELCLGDFIEEIGFAILLVKLPLISASLNQQSAYMANDSDY
jgi:hypothetical protein